MMRDYKLNVEGIKTLQLSFPEDLTPKAGKISGQEISIALTRNGEESAISNKRILHELEVIENSEEKWAGDHYIMGLKKLTHSQKMQLLMILADRGFLFDEGKFPAPLEPIMEKPENLYFMSVSDVINKYILK